MSAILQRQVFDAVVIDLGRSAAEAEEAIRWVEQIRPSLVGRILVLSQGNDRAMVELIERHDLIQLSQQRLLPHLWATLEERVVSPRSRESVPRTMPVARLIFDSLQHSLPAGVRTSSSGARQLAYQYERTVIDLSIGFADGSGRLRLTGQVMAHGKANDLSVLVVPARGAVARTTTNEFGEFHIEREFPEDLSLEIRLGERTWVLVPLGKMKGTDDKDN